MSATGRKTKKIYYSMGEVSEMFDVNPSLIRFWEQKFTILKPEKNKKGNRLFTRQDVDNLKLIYHLVKENGMTLAGAQKRLKENREGIERNLEIIERLQAVKAMLLEVRQQLKAGGGNDVEIIVEEDIVPVMEAPLAVEEPDMAAPQEETTTGVVAEAPPAAAESVAAETLPAWPREQPLFPEYVSPEELQPGPVAPAGPSEAAGPAAAPQAKADPVPEEEKPAGKRMQIIEQTLF